jgi:LytS/YehU family sensor histidine kinase
MNPHFLFNCLNSIQRFILENDSKNALTYLTKFARLVRLILENSRDKKVSLSKEIESLDLYIQMEKLRFNHNFSYSIIVDETIDKEDIQVTPMLLQPYVENAIWHGLQHKESDGNISVHISKKNNALSFEIEDNGIGRKASGEINLHRKNHTSFGLDITEKRIEMLSANNKQGTVNIFDMYDEKEKAKGTRVEINIPLE